MPGFKEADLYPTVKQPNFTLAKKLADGHTGNGKAVLYTFSSILRPALGADRAVRHEAARRRRRDPVVPARRPDRQDRDQGRGFDIGINGWGADYADPYDFINVLLDGTKLQAANNVNISYFNSPAYNKKMQAAASLSGPKRLAAYGNLDIDLMKNAAPLAPILNGNNRYFTSARVGCWTFQPVLAVPNLAGICLK